MSENLHTIIHHVDFFPLRIRVFRNGDMFDQGRILVVTRKQFKHWIVFLDALTVSLRTATAVKRLFTIQGIPVHHFDELETNGEYVAVENGPFINVPYGQSRFTLRGKRYNPIIRAPQMVPTFLNSAESMDIYLKKEGYGTITGLPYPFDGILSRSPSASNIQIKHLTSHIPPLKIGGSMEHLNEIGTASWLGKNEKWMMGERVKLGETQTKGEEHSIIPKLEIKDTDCASITTSEVNKDAKKGNSSSTKLPRLLNSNRSFKKNSNQNPEESSRPLSENLPPIDLKSTTQTSTQAITQTTQKDSDTISIKTEEEVISILKPSEKSEKISKKENDDEPCSEAVEIPLTSSEKPPGYGKFGKKESKIAQKIPEKSSRAKWADGKEIGGNLRREKSTDSLTKKEKSIEKLEGLERNNQKSMKSNLKKFDVDINEIPIRYEGATGRSASRIVTSRSTTHLFIEDYVGEDELDDVIERAQLWDMNRRRQKMRQQCTQTSASMCRSISAPRRRVVLFDPDFD
ncbi:hypothetical protein L5515_013576 [Caenorhabditis briggsae]|uniref:Doublecortin domain-containing protein n=1 Tax=Caenorhabditis briggsae TaxID=6238 RepID=A0AAE9EBQ1_CAEBR|nr:hypothetical protein L5515_013576 [Caenorhabditis briggsae]